MVSGDGGENGGMERELKVADVDVSSQSISSHLDGWSRGELFGELSRALGKGEKRR